MRNFPKEAEAVQNDPTASYWLKEALRVVMRLDCIDAANDAEWLAKFLKDRADYMLSL